MPAFCPTCGKELQYENAEICPNCGVRIRPPPPQAQIRSPAAAVILSFLFTGWGQWYNGQTWEGVKYFGAFIFSYVLLFIFAILMKSDTLAAVGMLLMFVVLIAIWAYGMYDAYKIAERINSGELAFREKSVLFWLPVVLLVLVMVVIVAAVIAAFVFGMAAGAASYS